MLANELLVSPSFYVLVIAACITLSLFQAARNKWANGLNSIPGPALAAYTGWWRVLSVLQRRPELAHVALHTRYGPLVRLGPRVVSVSDPNAIKVIYGLNAGYSHFYTVPTATTKEGKPVQELFSTRDEQFHAKARRFAANAYALSSLVQFEPLVDSTTKEFLKQLSLRFGDRAGEDGVCDFGTWLQYYAFDVIGELTFSKRLGFLERGTDVDGIIGEMGMFNNYSSVAGQMPILDNYLLKNPLLLFCARLGWIDTTAAVLKFAKQRIAERDRSEDKQNVVKRPDFLSYFLQAQVKDPKFMSDELVLSLTAANVFAGSDTTAISLRAIFYYLLRQPETLARLQKEIDGLQGLQEDKQLVSWAEVHGLPYLSAVIKEALRCHPAVGLGLERIVPSSGLEICGQFLPPGTVVGINAWTVHQCEDVFGANPSSFVPERWLDRNQEDINKMNSSLFSFGAGARTCIGKNISYLEMYKVVPALLKTFEIDQFG